MNHKLIQVSCMILFICATLLFTYKAYAEDKYWIKVIPTVTGPFIVDVDIQTNIPGSVTLSMSLGLNGLKPDDKFIGTEGFIRIPITNGIGKGTIDATNPNRVFPHGFPLPNGKYDVEVSFYPGWAENAEQASKLGIKKPIEGKDSVKLAASGVASSKSDKPSPQFLKFKELYLELISFKDDPLFHSKGFEWETARVWNKKLEELRKFSNQTEIFTNEQINLEIYAADLVFLSADYMNKKETELTHTTTKKFDEAFGIKTSREKKNNKNSENAYEFDIKAYCAKVAEASGGSYQIEETCREQEGEALRKIDSMNIPKKTAKYCRDVGRAVGGSYAIMHTCINQELEAKSHL